MTTSVKQVPAKSVSVFKLHIKTDVTKMTYVALSIIFTQFTRPISDVCVQLICNKNRNLCKQQQLGQEQSPSFQTDQVLSVSQPSLWYWFRSSWPHFSHTSYVLSSYKLHVHKQTKQIITIFTVLNSCFQRP